MPPHARPRLAALPVTAAVAAALSLGAAPSQDPAHPPRELVEMEVLGVMPLDAETASVLLLREKKASTVLPIFIGRNEGVAIDLRLKNTPPPRPLAADLLERAISALGGRVLRVEIDGAHAQFFRARVRLEQGDRELDVEARPSDSVALAVSSRAPIFATRAVLVQAGLTKEALDRMARSHQRSDEEREGGRGVQSF